MTKPSSPFAGVKLSDLVSNPSSGPLDQQLFSPAPPPAPADTPAQPEAPHHQKDATAPRRLDSNVSRQQDVKTSIRQDPNASLGQHGKVPKQQDVTTARPKDGKESRRQGVGTYDINDETFERETVRVTKAEQRAIEQLKLSLREILDSTVGKNDIFRAGLHFLLDDFQANGEHSEIVSRLGKKTK